ncbi:MAG: hypothetical protein K0R55_2666 [Sporomusa sp.]|nr:hypothetical protein [Sporomusa sp.]
MAILTVTLIVYKLANSLFGVDLRLRSLLLCAACAMFISLVLPKIVVGFAGLPGTLAFLAFFAIIFAYFIAKYEDVPSVKETESACCLAVSHAQSDIVEQTEVTGSLPNECINDNQQGAITEKGNEYYSNTEPVVFLSEETLLASNTRSLVQFTVLQNDSNDSSEGLIPVTCDQTIVAKESLVEELLVEESLVEESLVEELPVEELPVEELPVEELPVEELPVEELPVEESPVEELPIEESSVEELPIEKSPVGESLVEKLPVGDRIGQEEYEEYIEEVSQLTSEQAGVTVQEAENSITLDDEKVLEEIDHPASEQLDNLLDFAFLNKERHNEEVALLAFKQALALYPNGEAAPFLVVEVGNLLKNKGNYDEAIKVFSDGRSLCQSREDEMMEQEFISTIAYLRIIKNILLQHRLGCIKFLEIPQHILKEIDEEFREWRNVANI